jgi:hypothetical protein
MTGDRDTRTLPDDAREVFANAREPKTWWLVSGAGHVDLYGFAKERYEEKLREFLASIPSSRVAGDLPTRGPISRQ